MIKLDEDALICDLAETYHIYDYKQLPPKKVAVFSLGLRDNSRIKMKLSGQTVTLETLLLAGINDFLSIANWMKTQDGQKGRNRPTSISEVLMSNGKPKEAQNQAFGSGEDYEKARQQILIGMQGGED